MAGRIQKTLIERINTFFKGQYTVHGDLSRGFNNGRTDWHSWSGYVLQKDTNIPIYIGSFDSMTECAKGLQIDYCPRSQRSCAGFEVHAV